MIAEKRKLFFSFSFLSLCGQMLAADGLLLQVKAMVVGRQGAVIGQIGKLARLELDVIFQKTTHLVLQVKVEKKHGQS
jgi:hypothetical protein